MGSQRRHCGMRGRGSRDGRGLGSTQMPRSRLHFLSLALATLCTVAASALACSSASRTPSSFGASCAADADCASGACDLHRCTQTCASNDDCIDPLGYSPAGCVNARGATWCRFLDCPSSLASGFWTLDPEGNACVGERPVACQLAKSGCGCTSCSDSEYCPGFGACQKKKQSGQTCGSSFECNHIGCNQRDVDGVQVCTVPLGAACTDQNCSVCRRVGVGTVCSRGCAKKVGSQQGDCPAGYLCSSAPGDKYSNLCIPTCTSNADCPSGASCNVLPDLSGMSCTTN